MSAKITPSLDGIRTGTTNVHLTAAAKLQYDGAATRCHLRNVTAANTATWRRALSRVLALTAADGDNAGILFVGDSYVAGYGAGIISDPYLVGARARAWPNILGRQLAARGVPCANQCWLGTQAVPSGRRRPTILDSRILRRLGFARAAVTAWVGPRTPWA